MIELRKDPIVDRWVLIAKNRAARPQEFVAAPRRQRHLVCPFCPGSEQLTPHEIDAIRDEGSTADARGWRARVLPNKFAAVLGAGEGAGAAQLGTTSDGLYASLPAEGVHEVIIEAAEHLVGTSQLPLPHLHDIFRLYQRRLLAARHDERRLRHGLIFKNVGEAAGASIEHLHSQLIALPIVPPVVWEELTGALEVMKQLGKCAWCEMIDRELADGRRVVLDAGSFVAFCPYAARFAGETWIVPKRHASHYEWAGDAELGELAAVAREVLGKLETTLDRVAYNYMLHTAPFDTQRLDHYHWHLEIIPRVTRTAGFEWGTGCHINPLPPEEAAERLRIAAWLGR